MNKRTIIIPKTARYFMLGEAGPQVRELWIVCHGYAQLANDFLELFRSIDDGTRLLAAPEGLHRFYARGVSDRVAASWMTKEDRLDDIRDYIGWLDAMYADLMTVLPANVVIHVLGFSQGAATVCRWAATGQNKIDHLTLFCGFFPPDMDLPTSKEVFDRMQVRVVTASDDVFIKPEQEQQQLQTMQQQGISFTHQHFEGVHTVDPAALATLAASIRG